MRLLLGVAIACLIFSSEKMSIFSEEIMMHLLLGELPACLIIASEENVHHFLKR